MRGLLYITICVLGLTGCTVGDTVPIDGREARTAELETYQTGNEDFDRMLGLSVSAVREVLDSGDLIVPFAVAIRWDGQLAGVFRFEPELSSGAAVQRTVGELSRGVRTGLYRSTAICTDVLAPAVGGDTPTDAVSIVLEDAGGAHNFILPYERTRSGVQFGRPYLRHERPLAFDTSITT